MTVTAHGVFRGSGRKRALLRAVLASATLAYLFFFHSLPTARVAGLRTMPAPAPVGTGGGGAVRGLPDQAVVSSLPDPCWYDM